MSGIGVWSGVGICVSGVECGVVVLLSGAGVVLCERQCVFVEGGVGVLR